MRSSMTAGAGVVPTAEVIASVDRMEARFSVHRGTAVKELFHLYTELALRFELELGASERDVALSKASALMLVQDFARSKNAL